jgi:hypothetical protein
MGTVISAVRVNNTWKVIEGGRVRVYGVVDGFIKVLTSRGYYRINLMGRKETPGVIRQFRAVETSPEAFEVLVRLNGYTEQFGFSEFKG